MGTLKFLLVLIFASSSFSREELKFANKRSKRWDNDHSKESNFRGSAGVDYPNYSSIPNTSFRCSEQQYEGGLYADVEAQCQVYHVCHEGRKDSFLCGQGTIFNQQILACDYWYSTECDTAPNFYYVNAQIGSPGTSSNSNPQLESGYGRNGPDNLEPRYVNVQDPPNIQGFNSEGGNYGSEHAQTGAQNPEPRYGNQQYPRNIQRHSSDNTQAGVQNLEPRYGNEQNPQNIQGYNSEGGTYYSDNAQTGVQEENATTQRQNGPQPGNDRGQDSSCCCLKNQYKAPWSFPARASSRK